MEDLEKRERINVVGIGFKVEVDGWINFGRKVGRRKGRYRYRYIWEVGRVLFLRVFVFFVK